METFKLKIDDGICKGFKNEDESIDFFVNKAYDEESDMHALLIFIPKIPEFNILQVQNPVFYESEEERDRVYRDNITDEFATNWFDMICSQIREQMAQSVQEHEPISEDVEPNEYVPNGGKVVSFQTIRKEIEDKKNETL